jgi:Excalibur calcium-binding domain/Domain of unknown function (DUF4189)
MVRAVSAVFMIAPAFVVCIAIPPAGAVPFGSCGQVRAAGLAPLLVGQPGYSRSLDRDGDGVACELTAGSAPAVVTGFGWAAVAGSPSREQTDWSWGRSAAKSGAESQVLQHCAVRQTASDCVLLASHPSCVAVVWDAAEPLNRAHGGVGPTPQSAVAAAAAVAGPYANDPGVRCSWDPEPTL